MLQTNAPLLLWGLLVLGGLTVIALLIQATLAKSENHIAAPLTHVFRQLGLDALPLFLAIVLSVLWSLLFLLLLAGLFGLIADVLLTKPPSLTDGDAVWDWRFKLVQLTALTTVLGAVVILPVTLQRLRLSKEQTETAKAALFNEKITEAAADLHSTRQVSKETENGWETVWEDDVVRRNAAIDRLEGLVREQPEEAARVSRLLSVYVRELSKAFPAKEPPNEEDTNALKAWAEALEVPRSDMQNAAQVLGRLANISPDHAHTLEIDLSSANLQAMSLPFLNFEEGYFHGTSLQGAELWGANLHKAEFPRAKMQGASFGNANLKMAILAEANLQGAYLGGAALHQVDLSNAALQRANLAGAEMNGANLVCAQLHRANLWNARMENVDLRRATLEGANLANTELSNANLRNADLKDANFLFTNLQEANLRGAVLQHAKLRGVKCQNTEFGDSTVLNDAAIQGAFFKFVDFSKVREIAKHLDDAFGDGSVTLPPEIQRPPHWPKEDLNWDEFHAKWRVFAASKGVPLPD